MKVETFKAVSYDRNEVCLINGRHDGLLPRENASAKLAKGPDPGCFVRSVYVTLPLLRAHRISPRN